QGPELMQKFIEQAKRFGAEMINEDVNYVDLSGDIKIVRTAKNEFKSKVVIIATGALPRRLDIPGEEEFYGRGVSTCATCDGAFYKDKVVAVIGGGDSAMEESTFLTKFASKVYLIHRGNEFRASKIMADRAKNNPKIEILFNTEVKEVIGGPSENDPNLKVVKKIKLFNNKENSESELYVDGVFLAIGHIPVTGVLKDKLPLDDHGYVTPLSFGSVKTNIPGVFVAGEVQDHTYKQAITTAADGCKAAIEAERWLAGK